MATYNLVVYVSGVFLCLEKYHSFDVAQTRKAELTAKGFRVEGYYSKLLGNPGSVCRLGTF